MITIGTLYALAAILVLASVFKHPGWRLFWFAVLMAQAVYFTTQTPGIITPPKTTVYLTT